MNKSYLTRNYFESLYKDFNLASKVYSDPLAMINPKLSPEDFEIVSFLAAGISYGRVEQIQKSCAGLWQRLEKVGIKSGGTGISSFLKNSPNITKELSRALKGWVHRMNTHNDMLEIFESISFNLKANGSLCRTFQLSFAENPRDQLNKFCAVMAMQSPKKNTGKRWMGTGASWFACAPESGSTCKRLMMWLRWMIRKDFVDPGIWQTIYDPNLQRPTSARLFWPVDTHVFRWAHEHKLLSRKNPGWKSVEEITTFFKVINPEDPVRYDFAICHTGMEALRKIELEKSREPNSVNLNFIV